MSNVTEFDAAIYFLGNLCKREHRWNNSSQSLRYRKGVQHCVECQRLAARAITARKVKPDCIICGERIASFTTKTVLCGKEDCVREDRRRRAANRLTKKRLERYGTDQFQCIICGEYTENPRRKSLCRKNECRLADKRQKVASYQAENRQKTHGDNLASCAICGKKLEYITGNHLSKHGISADQYKALYPNAITLVDRIRDTRSKGSLIQSNYLNYSGKKPDSYLIEFLTGALLGDGHIERRKGKNARYAEGGSNKMYMEWKYRLLTEYIPCSFEERLSSPHAESGKQYLGWWLRTSVHPVLSELHKLWYQDRKIVPFDFIEKHLTEFALAVWFCDDGHSGKSGGYLYTMGFSVEETEFLSHVLETKFEIFTTIRYNSAKQPYIYIRAKSKPKIQEIVSRFQIPGMEYKYIGDKYAVGLQQAPD